MRVVAALAVIATLLIGVAGCAEQHKTYGAGSAGPTLTPGPATRPSEPVTTSTPTAVPRERVRPCLFSDAEVARVLGLAVLPGTRSRQGSYVVCTWKARDAPTVPSWRRGDPVLRWDDGLVTITRGPAASYADLADRVVALAKEQKATGRHDLPSAGEGGFAIGGSVSGVPLWHAVAVHHDQVVAVEVSGAGSRSGIAAVTDVLLTALDRT